MYVFMYYLYRVQCKISLTSANYRLLMLGSWGPSTCALCKQLAKQQRLTLLRTKRPAFSSTENQH